MRIGKVKGFLLVAVLAIVACVFQVVGLVRHLDRLPEDKVGVGLYIATIVAFALVAVGYYAQWRRQKSKD